MDPHQLSGLETVQLLELLRAVVVILQRRLGTRRGPAVVDSAAPGQGLGSSTDSADFSEFFLTCEHWSIHCTPRRDGDSCDQLHRHR